MKIILYILLLLPWSIIAQGNDNWHKDFEKAKKVATAQSKPILISFSGSDWCKPCIILKNKAFNTSEFRTFAKDSLVLFNADFPRKKENKPTPELLKQYEQLAEQYNNTGSFPYNVLVTAEGKILGRFGFVKGGPESFLKKLRPLLKKFDYKAETSEVKRVKEVRLLMGVKVEVIAVSEDEGKTKEAVNLAFEEIARIEKVISSWDENSETSSINNNAGIEPVKVNNELISLINRSKKVSELTKGAFDISYASLDNIWNFNGEMKTLPSEEDIKNSVSKVNYNNIITSNENSTVFLKEAGMKIGFGAIGKGYAANKAKALLIKNGINNGMVSVGGDLIAWGKDVDGKEWKIGIADPKKETHYVAWLTLEDMAIVTSGNYEKFITIDGEKYAHIIDPRTGYPAKGLKSVTIICPDTELADALATAVFVMGKQKGLDFINQLTAVECILVTDEDEILTSKNLNLNYVHD